MKFPRNEPIEFPFAQGWTAKLTRDTRHVCIDWVRTGSRDALPSAMSTDEAREFGMLLVQVANLIERPSPQAMEDALNILAMRHVTDDGEECMGCGENFPCPTYRIVAEGLST